MASDRAARRVWRGEGSRSGQLRAARVSEPRLRSGKSGLGDLRKHALLALALPLLAAGPAVVYLVPEEQAWQVALQAVAALVCVVGGAAAVAASTFVSRLQGSSS